MFGSKSQCIFEMFDWALLQVKKEDWFKLKINNLKYLKFIIFNENLIKNIKKFELKKIFNYQINELSSSN